MHVNDLDSCSQMFRIVCQQQTCATIIPAVFKQNHSDTPSTGSVMHVVLENKSVSAYKCTYYILHNV